jgi:hypothetical protein
MFESGARFSPSRRGRIRADFPGGSPIPVLTWRIEAIPRAARPDAPLALLRRPDDDEAIGIGIRQRSPEYAVGDGKDRGVEADAERQRGESRERERRIAPHQPQRVSHVLSEGFRQHELLNELLMAEMGRSCEETVSAPRC